MEPWQTADLDFPPYRLSGTVYGTLMNDPRSLAALGDAVHAAPYQAPPRAPVLYLKPRNCLSGQGRALRVPAGFDALRIGVNLGMVIGRVACNVPVEHALEHVAGYVLVNDVSLPHDSFYRPSVRLLARDGYCPLGPAIAAEDLPAHPDRLDARVWIDGALARATSTGPRVRGAARLLAEVSEFMTLRAGDVLMLGASHGAPLAYPGQQVAVEIDGIGRLDNPVRAEEPAP